MEWYLAPQTLPEGEVVILIGDFDLYEGPRFAREIVSHVQAGHTRLVLDLGAVDYLDSCGVGIIIKLLQQIRLAGGSLHFRGLHGTPRRVLEMSNVLNLLKELPAADAAAPLSAGKAGGRP